MPVSVNAVLRDSLAGSSDHGHHQQLLQTQIASATKHLVLKNVEYEEYPENFLAKNDALKKKYILLSDKSSNGCSPKKTLASPAAQNGSNGLDHAASNGTNGSTAPSPNTPKKDNKNELPLPKRTLFPRDKVQIGWKGGDRKWQIGAGFINVGNTCYLNSTLQALLHVPAMANWLASDVEHRERCAEYEPCIICAVAKTLQASQSSSGAVKPWLVYSRLKQICKHLVPGRQEDAHEFLRYLIEAMEKAFLQRIGKAHLSLDQYSKETTPLNQILGGYLRSSVRCLSCGHISITFQHFEDLLLDIRKANTVDEALQGYFSREKLEDMGYNCEGCKKKVTATKQFSLERPPAVLCLQLKRFSMQGSKLNKQVSIKSRLDLTPYVRKTPTSTSGPLSYRLVSMVTHLGSSQHCGHYTAIGVTESGMYYQFDDSYVHPISLQNVLQTSAYIIFYELEHGGMARNGSNGVAAPLSLPMAPVLKVGSVNGSTASVTNGSSSKFIGPVLPPNHPSLATKEREVVNDANRNGTEKALENGHDKGNGSANGKTTERPATPKKYPSAELLFKSPSKPSSSVVVNGTNGGTSTVNQPHKPKGPFSFNFSSDDDDDDDGDKERSEENGGGDRQKKRETPSPAKTNGHHTPYVNSNSGPWKVVDCNGSGDKPNGSSLPNGKAVLNELLKQDHGSYGGVAVSTWSGQKSSFDKGSSSEKTLKRQSDRRADDDEEMDRGRVKKMKLNNKVGRDNPGFNAFQEFQNKQQGSNGGYGNQRQWVNNGQNNQYHNKSKPHHNHWSGGNHNNNRHFNKRPKPWQNHARHKHAGGGGNGRFKHHFNGNGRKSSGGGYRHGN